MPDKHPLRTFIVGTAIGGLLLGLLQWLTGFISTSWHACKLALIWLFHLILSSVPVPVWLIVLVSPLIIPTLFRIFYKIRRKDVKPPTWRDYKEDDIMGMRWRWSYGYYSGDIYDIVCFCPSDDTQLIYEDWGSKIAFRCETCDRRFGPFEGHRNYFLGRIERQIHRKLRSDEWKTVVERVG